jgi:8-oxo-dGTP pyrophosphatase MutT (NUDIX family)
MVPPKKQIAALPWRRKKDRIEILLITSRETKRWVIPKGWPMDHLLDYNAARQEALEEAGVKGHVQRDPIGFYDYDKRLKDGTVQPCRVCVFALEVNTKHSQWREREQRKREWFTSKEAILKIGEPGLQSIISQFSP